MPGVLTQAEYGKSQVRLTKIDREAQLERATELSVDVSLRGDFEDVYRAGDNRLLVPTDTIKNIVYILARRASLDSIESFGVRLGAHLLEHYEQVEEARVHLQAMGWAPLASERCPGPVAFCLSGGVRWVSDVRCKRNCTADVSSGFRGLRMIKTRGSSFGGFFRDEYTTLDETDERVLFAGLEADWDYGSLDVSWNETRQAILHELSHTFARHPSRSLQHTLHAMGEAVLSQCPPVRRISVRLENETQIAVDLSAFGLDNSGALFVPGGQPVGRMSGIIARKG